MKQYPEHARGQAGAADLRAVGGERVPLPLIHALALVKRTVPVEATLLAGSGVGVAAAQEVIVPPDAGANVKVTLKRRPGLVR